MQQWDAAMFRAASTLGVSTWQPGCAYPTLRLQAFVCLRALPRPPQHCPQALQYQLCVPVGPKLVGSYREGPQAPTPRG